MNKLQWLITFAGMLIAAQIQYIQHGWINPDSTIYFESARLFAIGEWKAAYATFHWPLYAILIAAVHKLTTFSIHLSAQILNVVFFGVTTFSFIKILQLAGGKNLVLFSGALILFSSQYIVGDVLAMLLRDVGFWAFFLTSLVFFIRFIQSRRIFDAFFWQICAITATLFRIEGITFLLGLPFTLFFLKPASHLNLLCDYIKTNALSIFAILTIFVIIIFSSHLNMDNFGRLDEVFTLNFYHEVTGQLFQKAKIMSELVLGKYLNEYAVIGLLIIFVFVMIAKTISATGLINLGIIYFGVKENKNLINPHAVLVLKAIIVLAIFNMGLIIVKVFVLSGRYILPLTFALLLITSVYLANYIESARNDLGKNSKKNWIIYLIMLIMALGIIKNVLPKKDGYNFRQDTVTWLKQHNPNNKSVFYDDPRVRYYAGLPFIGSWGYNWKVLEAAVNDKTIQNYEFLVISQSSKHPEINSYIKNNLPQYTEINKFISDNKSKYLAVYQKKWLSHKTIACLTL